MVRRLPIAIGRDISTLSPEELARTRSAGAGLRAFVDTVLSRHSASDQNDVVGRLLAGESDDRLSEQELFANIVLLLIAGHENSSITAWARRWPVSKAASHCGRFSSGGRPSAKPESWCTRTTSTCDFLHSLPVAGCRILSATAKLRPQKLARSEGAAALAVRS